MTKLLSRPIAQTMIAAGVAAGTAVAVTSAAIPGPDGTIRGCYSSDGGALRVVDENVGCGPTETLLRWNQTGPQGPAGQTGPQGPAGPTGPVGEPRRVVTVSRSAASGRRHVGGATVVCPSGTSVLGGGHFTGRTRSGQRFDIVLNRPTSSGRGWQVTILSNARFRLGVEARCG